MNIITNYQTTHILNVIPGYANRYDAICSPHHMPALFRFIEWITKTLHSKLSKPQHTPFHIQHKTQQYHGSQQTVKI